MNTPDTLSAEPEKPAAPRFIIGVRLSEKDKPEFFNLMSLNLKVGVSVVVETADGPRLGVVASSKIVNFGSHLTEPLNKVLRIANDNDLQMQDRKEKAELYAKSLCLEKINLLKLPMNLSRVVNDPQANKTIFFFTAEGRVDFRQLIKELVSNLRHRIEMKQVGVRDEARVITGYGMCGQTLCCTTMLNEFNPVTIRMAKDQGLALNPTKISGVCGRLMCCLQYEHEVYRSLIKNLPKVNSHINTPEGPGKVLKNEILEQKVLVRLDDESIMSFHLDELKGHLKTKNADPAPSKS